MLKKLTQLLRLFLSILFIEILKNKLNFLKIFLIVKYVCIYYYKLTNALLLITFYVVPSYDRNSIFN